jgi:hypothetical protein
MHQIHIFDAPDSHFDNLYGAQAENYGNAKYYRKDRNKP